MAIGITVNGKRHSITAAPDTPLFYVLRDDLRLRGPKFGCDLSQCGACAVLVNRKETRSCVTPVVGVVGKSVTTLEGLPARYAQQKKLAKPPALHPLQQAWIDEQVPQWDGYPIIRFTDVPTVEVISIDRPDLPATGSGEPSCNPIAPAIGNAVFDGVGIRLRSMPMNPKRVKTALSRAA